MSLIKERPILFSSVMVRAILDGTKTQTRRVIKLRNDSIIDLLDDDYLNERGFCSIDTEKYHAKQTLCPFGKRGDSLWVREIFAQVSIPNGTTAREIITVYKADNPQGLLIPNKWEPSIFMPRRASRITMEITNIRVEQIQQISLEDVEAEGIRAFHDAEKLNGDCPEFIKLWNEINAKRGFSWESNPFVWVIEFEVKR